MQRQNVCGMLETEYDRNGLLVKWWMVTNDITEVLGMGSYLNPGCKGFEESLNSAIYVDKTGLIEKVNAVVNTRQKYICVSRPRRFGKSMATDMLAAYYDQSVDTARLFDTLQIARHAVWSRDLLRLPWSRHGVAISALPEICRQVRGVAPRGRLQRHGRGGSQDQERRR